MTRYWYFAELNERGGVRDRFGPFQSKHEAETVRQRMHRLYPERHLSGVHSSVERYPSNVPSWARVFG